MEMRQTYPLPPVVLSEQNLWAEGIAVRRPEVLAPVSLPISAEGITYDMAQSAAWVDEDHFAVGRWDGSLTLFRFSEAKSKGPLIAVAASSPSYEGVQMITWVAPRVIATSNDDQSIAIWKPNTHWDRLELVAQLKYDKQYGAANSGDAFTLSNEICLVVGHANGFISIWTDGSDGSKLTLRTVVDVRSSTPTNPWGIHNIRGIAAIEFEGLPRCVVSGSEDGDICVISIPDGKILSRTVYNPKARRGINALSANGMEVLVANCSVGPDDNNLWLYTVDPSNWAVKVQDATNLKVNGDDAQVFNFSVVWGEYEKGRCFFSSTQDGALWMGTATGGKLHLLGHQSVTSPLGAALAYASNGNLAFVAYDLYEFKTLPVSAHAKVANPQRLA